LSEKQLLSIKPILTKFIPESEVSYVSSKEEMLKIIETSFYMLIIPVEYIDIEALLVTPLTGTVIVLDESIDGIVEINEQVQKFKDIESVAKRIEQP
jgi:hypothetical protein